MKSYREAARHSVRAKIAALAALEEQVIDTPEFDSAVSTLLMNKGKCIVTGIGKSGLIGRKIVATMISTGQRAAFLHPGEAAHGDMGMIDRNDVILFLSNSGATEELFAVQRYAQMLALPQILISSREAAPLCDAVQADDGILLLLPRMPEGCPIERAPMASTVAQLAIGDAIAAALMVRRNFSGGDFADIHHGGYLGQLARDAAA